MTNNLLDVVEKIKLAGSPIVFSNSMDSSGPATNYDCKMYRPATNYDCKM